MGRGSNLKLQIAEFARRNTQQIHDEPINYKASFFMTLTMSINFSNHCITKKL